MIKELEMMIEKYSQEIKGNFADYVALYAAFIKYVKGKHGDYADTMEEFLKHDINKNDIIQSCVFYVTQSEKVSSTKAVDKYLNAMSKLYEECFEKCGYGNRNLFALLPFGGLKTEVLSRLRDLELRESSTIDEISERQKSELLKYFDSYSRKQSDVFFRNEILIKLILLYGFKLERTKYMKIKDVDIEHHILNIKDEEENIVLSLELPFRLYRELEAYINILTGEMEIDENSYLFLSKNGKVIDSSFAQTVFDNIRKNVPDIENEAKLTVTGIAKYAIIKMIKAGISKADVKLITGMQDVVIDDCEERCFREKKLDKKRVNREINSKLRSIDTYDEVNGERTENVLDLKWE